MTTPQAPVVICMGSQSDWDTMQEAATILEELVIGFESRIISAHRTPGRLSDFASTAAADGVKVIIAGAGGAAHLPGMLAANTRLPVLGVPVESKSLKGMDSLLSIVQMPGGVPVGTLAIGKPGAKNAGLMAAQILAIGDSDIAGRLDSWREAQTLSVAETPSCRRPVASAFLAVASWAACWQLPPRSLASTPTSMPRTPRQARPHQWPAAGPRRPMMIWRR